MASKKRSGGSDREVSDRLDELQLRLLELRVLLMREYLSSTSFAPGDKDRRQPAQPPTGRRKK